MESVALSRRTGIADISQPRLRALALFGRRLPHRVEVPMIPASENQHRKRHRACSPGEWRTSEREGNSRLKQRSLLRSILIAQQIGTLIVNPLAKVPGSLRDLKPPAKVHT